MEANVTSPSLVTVASDARVTALSYTWLPVLAIDARPAAEAGRYEVLTHAGRKPSGDEALDWAARAEALGAGEILLTSWDRDGTGDGYDTTLLAAMRAQVSVPVIASGGAAGPEHMVEAVQAGASAVLAAGIFHTGRFSVRDVKTALATAGIEVRT